MKSKLHSLLVGLATLAASATQLAAQGTAFTYQGRLDSGGAPASGIYDFTFALYNAPTLGGQWGTTLTNSAVAVSNGLFTTTLDFGAVPFVGGDLWLRIGVRTNGGGFFTILSPRQQLTPTPYAIWAGGAQSASSVAAGGVTSAALANGAVTSGAIADASIGAGDLSPGLLNNTFWRLDGNAGTTPGAHFLGTTDNQAVELRANNQTAFRILPNPASPSLVGGAAANFVAPERAGAFIGGGGDGAGNLNVANGDYTAVVGGYQNSAVGTAAFVGGGSTNRATATASFVGGGTKNRAVNDYAVVAGGNNNHANGSYAAILGGNFNSADGSNSVVAGGFGNAAISESTFIGGGFANWISGSRSVLGGGEFNTVTNTHATLGGGLRNLLTGSGGTIGGGLFNTNLARESVIAGGAYNEIRAPWSTIGGGRSNSLPSLLASDATIAGGSQNTVSAGLATVGGGSRNSIVHPSSAGVIGGGTANSIASGALQATGVTIGGGISNSVSSSPWATIGGGLNNTVDDFSSGSVISGGSQNTIDTNAAYSAVGGGANNQINFGDYAAIGGGRSNSVSGAYAMIPGGLRNSAGGAASLAAGYRARANHDGSFVWADNTDADFASTADNQFAVRATGGLMINSLQATNTVLDLRGGGGLRVAGAGVNTATPIFTHRATAANITGSETRIDHPHCNNRPNAILILTYNFNPAGLPGTRNDRPFGLYYNGAQWAIYNLDGAAMPVGAAYNVLVANP